MVVTAMTAMTIGTEICGTATDAITETGTDAIAITGIGTCEIAITGTGMVVTTAKERAVTVIVMTATTIEKENAICATAMVATIVKEKAVIVMKRMKTAALSLK
jgi:hypothetical protein